MHCRGPDSYDKETTVFKHVGWCHWKSTDRFQANPWRETQLFFKFGPRGMNLNDKSLCPFTLS